jgi:hypothetical protein
MNRGEKKYMDDNVAQCWNCQRRVSAAIGTISGISYILPECSATGLLMTHVYDNPCRSFLQKERETNDR